MWIISVLLFSSIAHSKLIMVQEVFRHGARYPIYPSAHDNTMYAVEQDRVGELTSEGKRMHYLLGQRIYQNYWSALGLGDTVNNSRIYVKSTNINRTIQSAQSHLMGILQSLPPLTLTPTEATLSLPAWQNVTVPTQSQVFINIPKFHTAPIHTELAGSNQLNPGDFLFYFTKENCPNTGTWQQENFKTELAEEVRKHPDIREAIDKLEKVYGVTDQTLDQVGNFVDNFYCSYHLGRTYNTELFDGQYRNALGKQMGNVDTIRSVAYNLGGFGQELQLNSTITPFFKATLESMQGIIKGKSDRRLIIYSAHDMTLANILNGLRLTSAKCIWDQFLNPSKPTDCIWKYPDFASSIIFQLSQSDTDPTKYSIQIRYSGMLVKIPFCNNQLTCTYQQFESYLSETIRDTYMKDCGVAEVIKPEPVEEPSAPIGLIIPLCLVSALLFLIVVYEVYRYVKKRKEEANAGPYQTNVEEAA